MKILLTGAEGQLGTDCREVLRDGNEVLGVDLPDVDVARPEDIEPVLTSFAPELIVHAAAYTQVDQAEDEREDAERVNVQATRWLARASEERNVRLIFVSTDYVFDGSKPHPEAYEETDPVAPQTWYGVTKWKGEEAVREFCSNYVILRTAWLYGIGGGNFLKTILRVVRSGQFPRIVNDQYGSPTWSRRLALQIRELLRDGTGLYHAAGEGACTWYELACCFLDALGVSHQVQPCLTQDYPTRARRPANSAFRNARLTREQRNRMQPWKTDVRAFAEKYRHRLLAEADEAVKGKL